MFSLSILFRRVCQLVLYRQSRRVTGSLSVDPVSVLPQDLDVLKACSNKFSSRSRSSSGGLQQVLVTGAQAVHSICGVPSYQFAECFLYGVDLSVLDVAFIVDLATPFKHH